MAASKENRTISQFKSRLAGGGARPNLFEVELTLDGEGLGFSLPGYDATQMAFLCKAANLPAQNIASIDVPSEEISKLLEIEPSIHGLSPSSTMRTSDSEERWNSGLNRLHHLTPT